MSNADIGQNDLLKSRGNKPRTGKVLKCIVCEKEIYRSPSELGRKFCSRTCANKNQTKRKESVCKYCGGLYWVAPSKTTTYGQKYCSVDCYRDANVRKPKKIGNRRTGLMARTKTMAQKYARLRDCGGYDGYADCISCGANKHYSDLDGGHFIPSTCSYWKFDDRNINAQCIKCNRFLHGNARHYAKGMLDKYGQEVLDELEAHEFEIKKWTLEELDDLYEWYRQAIKEYS